MIIPEKTSGIIENLLASMILFSPNFVTMLPIMEGKLFYFYFYNFIVLFIVLSKVSHYRFAYVVAKYEERKFKEAQEKEKDLNNS